MKHRRPAAFALAVALALASSSCGDSARGGAVAPAERAKPTIGMVFDVGGRDDASFNRSAYDGLVMLARDSGGRVEGDPDADFGDAIDIRVLESKHGGADREQLLRSLAEDGRDLVIAVGFLFADSIGSVASDYPGTHFVIIDGTVPDLNASSSVTCVDFAEHEGSFLVGAYAGLLAAEAGPDARVGFVGGMDTPMIRRFLAGYTAGAAFVNPALRAPGRVASAFIARDASGFDDPARGAEMASMLLRVNSKVIFHAAGASGRGVFEAAGRFDAKAIGVDSDQAAILASSGSAADAQLSKLIVTSMLKRVDRAVYALGQELVAGVRIPGGYRTFGLAEGGVGYVADGLPSDAVTVLSDLARRVTSGEISVPSNDQSLADFISGLR